MAVAERITIIANPAKKRKARKAKGGKMTAKQIKYFGSKRQRAALKSSRKRKRNRPAAKKHRARTKPNPAPRKKRRTATVSAAPKKRRRRKNGAAKRKARKKNPGAIYALVNPATKGPKRMARTKKKRQRKHAAGTTKRRRNSGKRTMHRRRSNPGGMVVKDWLSLGAGAVIGGVGATQLPQIVLAGSNTGAVGYLANLAGTGILAAAAHMFMKGNKALVAGIIAGGVGATIKRVIGDYSLLGQYGASLGMGDYLSSDFLTPQSLVNGPTSAQLIKPSWGNAAPTPVNVAGAGGGMGYLGRPLY